MAVRFVRFSWRCVFKNSPPPDLGFVFRSSEEIKTRNSRWGNEIMAVGKIDRVANTPRKEIVRGNQIEGGGGSFPEIFPFDFFIAYLAVSLHEELKNKI
jgi:hypothetical protein